ncbi:hypothetical protein [Shewanella atlantica]|uniref:Carboxypeptidase regulatory-like domain-containing protein n=1 Tax=Shewanella atlantica TaxID=271099 RepID=A0A3S0KSV2_9GAMM|nr:hypothetical protein [Shewanella atlantica]RTR33646.1 hypothetical protein EKG39_08015 [Shewanella atlantica]
MPKFICLAILISLCLTNTAQAHRTKVFAWVDGTNLAGEVYFGGGERAKGAKVDLLVDKHLVASTDANEVGEFIFHNLEARDYQVSANAGQGHVATFAIAGSEFPEFVLSGSESTESRLRKPEIELADKNSDSCEVLYEAAMKKAIQPLRNQLDQYEANIRWHDVLGGMGYIFGLFGLWSLMRARRG